MDICSIQSTSTYLSCVNRHPCGSQVWFGNKNKISVSLVKSRVSRRRLVVLEFLGFNSMLLHVGVALGAPKPMIETKEPQIIRYETLKLPSGVRIEEIVQGEGPEAQEGNFVEVNYVCRRYNGYFVHSTVDQFSGESTPVVLPLFDKQIIQGLKEVLIGMRVGGKRRALIPPSVGYVSENLQPIPEEFGPRRSLMSHVNESLIFEVQLLKVSCACISSALAVMASKVGLCVFWI
ncbi:hypothetical protein IFM89_000107 [Coptis chinensis]|uniref:peptidylprolyl isomerase n=1 Tax=Coptis chinensis TaxID=261450 RepID=A0A835HVK6_9MAGN|nr:hypothetical protein IFM89_000107 [Coptis chinensis]